MNELVKEKWNNCLAKIKKECEISDMAFDTWLRPLKIIEMSDDVVVLLTDSKMTKEYVSKKYAKRLQQAITEEYGNTYVIEIKSQEEIDIVQELDGENMIANSEMRSFVEEQLKNIEQMSNMLENMKAQLQVLLNNYLIYIEDDNVEKYCKLA